MKPYHRDPTCWTDSKVTLYWILGETQESKQFVQNRVVEIRKLLPLKCWRHCPGKVNPADIASRGATCTDSGALQTWLDGLQWMLKDISKARELRGRIMTNFRKNILQKWKPTIERNFRTLVHSYAPKQVTRSRTLLTYEGLAVTRSLLQRHPWFYDLFDEWRKPIIRAEENKNSKAEIAGILWFKEIQLDLPNHPSFETWKNSLDYSGMRMESCVSQRFGAFWT
jgi:hypothetical protein